MIDIELFLTNYLDRPVTIVDAKVYLPAKQRWLAALGVRRRTPVATKSSLTEYVKVDGKSETQVHIHFDERPASMPPYESFDVTLELTDQFGHKHRLRRVHLFSWASPPRPRTWELERLYTLQTDQEKAVVSLLKLECTAYQSNTRGQGGLGSIGRIGAVEVSAGNGESFQRLWDSSTSEERQLIRNALRERVRDDGEYGPVAYFAVAMLYVALGLEEALDACKDLEEGKDYSCSNVLLMFEGLLLKHGRTWPTADLDLIERFALESNDCHAPRIQQAVASVRVTPLSSKAA